MDRKVVLVVEDNRDELLIYTTLLKYGGYTVLAAEDFESALRLAREQQPDLAIIDVNLGSPHYDGCDLVQMLRAEAGTANMPVIAHTAFADLYTDALARVGCERIIHKPTNPAVLIDAVEELIGQAPAPDTAVDP